MSLSSIRSWFAKGNRAQWCVFGLFCSVLFCKSLLFHFYIGHGVLLSSIWNAPMEFLRFWLGKVLPILFLGSFVFLSKRFWWTHIVNLFVDLWCIANLFYFKANRLFLSFETMKMADNLNGFWDSLLQYIGWDIFSFVIITIIYIPLLICCTRCITTKRQPLVWGIIFTCFMALVYINNICYKYFSQSWNVRNSKMEDIDADTVEHIEFNHYYPFGQIQFFFEVAGAVMEHDVWAESYVKDNSIISYFPACIFYHLMHPEGGVISLTEHQEKELLALINQNDTILTTPKYNIVFLLFESLESWPLSSVCGYDFMPNLSKLSQSPHVMYCNHIKSQVKHGNSADGQMIDVTGLLPISDGATCFLYGDNNFPSYTYLYDNSVFFKANAGLWNQDVITFNYGFKQLVEPQNKEQWEDKQLLDTMCNMVGNIHQPFCVVGFTISSHGPFSYGEKHPAYTIEGMPLVMNNYLNCLHYTDACIGLIIDTILHSDLSQNTILIVTGDHTIFRSFVDDIDQFAQENNIAMQTAKTYTPLIIYSPSIEGNVQITDTCYQMDIYPTILHLIDCEDYYWKGFGVNLLDSAARHNRSISEQEAYRLSDLMIRSNYFKEYYIQK